MKISQDVTYQLPVTQRTRLGGTPRDHFDQNSQPGESYVACANGSCANLPQEIWVDQPTVGRDGQAVMETIQEHVEESPYSPTLRGLGYGFVGGFAGATLGLMGGLVAGHPLVGLALGATALGGGAAFLGARSALGDQVSLEWDQHEVSVKSMKGYQETVTAGNLHGQAGFFHRYEPDFEVTKLGSYQTPRVVHSK